MAPRGKSARNFALDLKRFGDVTAQQAELIFRKIALELDEAVVMDTPVDTGRAKGNWFMSIGTPSDQLDWDKFDPSGTATMSEVRRVTTTAKLGVVIWATNNLPYILPLENGHSKRAREGMVDVNLARIASHYGGSIER